MERLTNKKEADAQRKSYEHRLKQGYPRNIPEERFLKLAAYEDAEEEGRWVALPPKTQDVDFMRIFELITADGEGRVIILPCKVGRVLYAPTRNFVSEFRVTQFDYGGYENPYLWVNWYLLKGITGNYRSDGIPAVEIGKTVFLTCKEAEAALKGEKTDG